MRKSLLKEVLSIPSCSEHESDVREFLVNWANENNINYRIDAFGNLFMMKGALKEGEAYPCVVAHMDTVHRDQQYMVGTGERLKILKGKGSYGDIYYAQKETIEGLMVNTGCGGDDKASVFICLELISKFDTIMGAFFVEEEIGCLGSRPAVNDEWLNQVGYFIQFDAPTDNWISRVCNGVVLFDNDFYNTLKPVWDKYELYEPRLNDPFTDIMALKKNYPVNCINYFAGYMNMHRPNEFVVLDYVEKAIKVGASTITKLGKSSYLFKNKK